MSYSFSEDILQRGTFPSERDKTNPVADYSSLVEKFGNSIESNTFLKSRVDALQKSLRCRCSAIESGDKPQWLGFFESLIATDRKHNFPNSDGSKNQIPIDVFEEAHAFPFFYAAQEFFAHISHHCPENIIASEHISEIYYGLTRWYLSRLVETGRFVLHIKYAESRLKYSVWCNKFHSSLKSDNPWFDITEEFPLLIRWLSNIDLYCKEAVTELFQRFEDDRTDIHSQLAIPTTAKIVEVVTGLSDPHRGGRSVMSLRFDNESQLVYKPKSLDIDAAFYKFVSNYSNATGIIPLKVLSKGDYGWVEYARNVGTESSSFANPVSIGQASACFWLLNTTDLHSENVLACGDGVFALDLETLLLAPAQKKSVFAEDIWRNHSIYTTMLFDFSFGEKRKQNISGFDPSQDLTTLAPQVKFNIVEDHVTLTALEPKELEAFSDKISSKYQDTVESIIKGFDSVTQSELRHHLNNFVEEISDNVQVRIVFRDTYFYARILDKMRQPRFLRDGALLYLDLFNLHVGLADSLVKDEKLYNLVDDEILQLLQGDIPYFSNRIDDLDLQTSSSTLANFFLTSGKKHSLEKISKFEDSDSEEQKALIKVAMGKYYTNDHVKNFANKESPIESLRSLSHHMIDSAFSPSRLPARWISMFGDVSGQDSRIFIGDTGFFAGSLGILLSLQAVEKLLISYKIKDIVISDFLNHQSSLWEGYLTLLHETPKDVNELLGFSGLGGEIFAQSVLFNLDEKRWNFLTSNIDYSLSNIQNKIAADKWLDVIGGCAGLILGCEQFHHIGDKNLMGVEIEEIQELCAKHLINQANKFDIGIAWFVPNEELPLLGYAHGWAGIVTALSCVARRTKDEVLVRNINKTLKESILYVDNLLVSYGHWSDYRGGESKSLNRSWCNGIAGILRGLLEVHRYSTKQVNDEATLFLSNTINLFGSSDVHRFCCGEMGNLDFILDYTQLLDHKAREDKLANAFPIIQELARYNPSPNEKFIPERAFPGLFHGQSGILYSSVRFFLPELPSLTGQDMNVIPNAQSYLLTLNASQV